MTVGQVFFIALIVCLGVGGFLTFQKTTCRACRTQISKKASICPNCQTPRTPT